MLSRNSILPAVDAPFRGPRFAFYSLVLITVAETVRRLIHMFAPDGGAQLSARVTVCSSLRTF
jgi:hypothetical protein